jgi:hypothetical protein
VTLRDKDAAETYTAAASFDLALAVRVFFAAAHRFFCAMEIFCRAAFDIFLRLRVLPAGRPLAPVFKAAIELI